MDEKLQSHWAACREILAERCHVSLDEAEAAMQASPLVGAYENCPEDMLHEDPGYLVTHVFGNPPHLTNEVKSHDRNN